ncbi:SDR family NAD(P)-dependent oxidoreductase [Leptotrichia sp. OH3620_COT-345]|uniref:SDR family NAD(P)-dependent oxidoreductase n=1 Tax=Leptotrichia sp. OH3620_COT-345 TaxID=2491048 RepID=UPI000F649ABD|nr:SDR family NAD(P)-dependent oxidoreductase [Leptotrichia sp. OH3620_COT-345]RRD39005.1 SDR family NAD(P)-dependent oxidoreductase [Leptotrichia sp. OH3620_COT-345]
MSKKYMVITGASSGIGKAAAKYFAKKEKNLILIARRKKLMENLKNEILISHPERDIIIKNFDLTDTDNIEKMYSSLKQYDIEVWINNAGFGLYQNIDKYPLEKVRNMIKLNIETLTILSILYVKDYQNIEGSQLINISSAGGYTIVPHATVYCATKFYVSSFTEGLARELISNGSKLKAKILAPAATKTEFGNIANNISDYDYDKNFSMYHTSDEIANFLYQLYESDSTLGFVNREDFSFKLTEPIFNHSYNSDKNQKIIK